MAVFWGTTTRAEQVVFSEIMYHPRGNQPEYIEIQNITATPLDMVQWRLEGGAGYEFPAFDPASPQAGFLKPYERIVLSGADPATARAAYGIPASIRIFGPWVGNLSDAGERITLQDKNGVIVCTVQYNDRGKWSPAADGAGHSLVLKNPNRAIDDWRNWTVSSRPGGTPGTEPVLSAETPVTNPELNLSSGIPVVDYGDTWRYHDQAVDLGTAWRQPGYNDSAWPQGPGLFGFENASLPGPGIRTGFADFDQLTFYLRKQFIYNGSLPNAVVTVDQVLDDGAVYYLNGQEMGRSRMTDPIDFNSTAGLVGDAVEELNVFPVNASLLINGTNTLAVEVHQTGPTSSDVVFGARVKVALPVQSLSGVVINEVLPAAAGAGFVEFHNPRGTAANLNGYYLTDRQSNLTRFRINGDLIVPPGGFASVGFVESLLTTTNPVTVFLVAPNGTTIENGLSAIIPPDGRSLGRKPSGGTAWFLFTDPTRDLSNSSEASLAGLVALNEIHLSASNTVDWIELHNRSNAAQAIDGLFVATQRDFSDKLPLTGLLSARGRASWSTSFPLSDGEVTLYLIDTANTVLDSRVFTQVTGRPSFQAFPEGGGEWYSSPTDTRNLANNPPRTTDIVINEIMFDPPSNLLDGEFIELHNRAAVAVDVSGWSFVDGPGFIMPSGTTIPAGGYLVVAANADRMRAVHGNINVVGDFAGRLSNQGELIRLVDPWGNLVNQVDYRFGGDWPDLTQGNGSSMELINPALDNSRASAWRDSNETNKAPFKTYTYTDTYRQLNPLGAVSDYKELHFHLVGDGYAILQNISLRKDGTGTNLIVNGTTQSGNNSGSTGWLSQGTHGSSYVASGQLHLISDGHGDNRANRAEIDTTGIVASDRVTLSFDARWVNGTPRLIGQTWDHSVGSAFRLEIPENLGTPGAVNSRYQAAPPPQIDGLLHSPAVPRSTENVRITARITSNSPLASVQVFHRIDNNNGDGAWSAAPMYDDGVNGGDAIAGDGVYSAELTEHRVNGRVVQFYVRATTQNGAAYQLPKQAAARPAMYVVDDRVIPRDLRTQRFIVSAYDRDAIANGEQVKHGYRYPRLSNHYFNMTFISNDEEIFYGGEIRNSGSPWTRGGDLSRGKWKLPTDRRFRNHEKFYYDNDPTAGRMHNNRITRYWLYLLGHPVNENEFVRVIVNSGTAELREDTEPLGNDLLDRLFENGSAGELYRIDDEWWFQDNWNRNNRNADWSYKTTENPVRYHTEWMKRTMEDDYDYSALINLFRTLTTSYTQPQIERLVDAEAVLKMAAVRGYIGDWDSFTLNRGKNGYLYRRWSDGRFMFMHWDSDLAFQSSSEVLYNGSRPGIGPYLSRPYNLRRFYNYLTELLDDYTLNSPRIEAWLQAEEDANSSFTVASGTYRSWFSSRRGYCLTRMGTGYTQALAITTNNGQPLTTTDDTISISGTAPYSAFDVEVEGHPEAVATWAGSNGWTLSGIYLRSGVNLLNIRSVDQWGNVVQQAVLEVTRTGNAPPRLALKADPNSWNVAVESALNLDARDSFDPEGTALTYAWTPPSLLANFDTNQPGRAVANFLRPGLYSFSVLGRDANGQQSTLTREASVYGANGFSPFDGQHLDTFWNLANVNYRDNYAPGAWISLSDSPGDLTIQVLDDAAAPLTNASPSRPWIWRSLPTGTDWVLQTRFNLASRQFGDYVAGLEVELVESGATNRYVYGIENGLTLAAQRLDAAGVAVPLQTSPLDVDEVVVRIRRAGSALHFEQRADDVWLTRHSVSLSPNSTAARGGIMVATSLPQSIRIRFDYAMLIDPSNTSELRENLRITEIMYNPIGGDDFEYLELMNIGATPLDLTGARFTNGVQFTFGPALLGAGERIVVVRNLAVFTSLYGSAGLNIAAGVFTGRLDNGGETLVLVDAADNVILSFTYGDSGDWPERADGAGSALEIVNPRGDYDDSGNWNSTSEYLGSPGRAGAGPASSIVINEVLTHTDPPLEDAVELYNPTAGPVNVGGWYLSDDVAVLKKYRIPNNTIIAAGGYLVLTETQFNNAGNPPNIPFSFDSAHGDDVWLTAADAAGNLTVFVDNVDFGASENGVAFGRFPNGSGPIATLSGRTFGAANASPRVGPVVINRIMYNPIPGGDEFIELLNIATTNAPLYDPAHATNTWQLGDAVDYQFPTNVVLTPGERLLVTPLDPAVFRARYSVPPATKVFGPWIGALDNNGEGIELYKPDPPQTLPPEVGFVPSVLVERVRYNNREPWPVLADGQGPALQRRVPEQFGNDPANWFTDFDADGMPDDWEVTFQLSPFYAGDADLDLDGDGFTNLEEFLNGTDPRDASTVLRISSVRQVGNTLFFEFAAAADQTYTVQMADSPATATWGRYVDVAAETFSRTVEITDSLTSHGPARFYRIVTPQIP